MGYYTDYELEIYENRSNLTGEQIKNAIISKAEELCILGYAFDRYLEPCDSVKWHDHDEHMREISKDVPNVVLLLSGEGEDSGDIWNKYYLNGKCQECFAQIIT